jgi:hypothetical protein
LNAGPVGRRTVHGLDRNRGQGRTTPGGTR